jgi:hypothetical protein
MQTLEFTRALSDIAKRLKADEIVSLMQPWVSPATPPNTPIDDGARDKFYELVLASHSGYDQLSRVGPTDRILSELNIRETYEPARLRRMTVFLANSSTIQQVRTNGELYGFFEILRSLLKFDRTCRNLLEKEKIGEVPASDEVLEFLFADYEGKGVEPERLSAAFMELAELQMNVARLLGVADHRLRVKYLDSGSDIKIGLEGAREVIEAVGALFLQFWDKIRFRDQDTFEKDMEALSKALEFLAKSEEAVRSYQFHYFSYQQRPTPIQVLGIGNFSHGFAHDLLEFCPVVKYARLLQLIGDEDPIGEDPSQLLFGLIDYGSTAGAEAVLRDEDDRLVKLIEQLPVLKALLVFHPFGVFPVCTETLPQHNADARTHYADDGRCQHPKFIIQTFVSLRQPSDHPYDAQPYDVESFQHRPNSGQYGKCLR